MADIFISYSRTDSAFVDRLAEAVRKEGYSVWIDRGLSAGATFAKETAAALDAAHAVIVVWSKASAESTWVADEATVAKDKTILAPIMIDETGPPLGFRQFQTIDFRKWNGEGTDPAFVLLNATLARLCGREAQDGGTIVMPPPQKNSPPATRRWLVPVAAAAVVAIATAGFFVMRSTDDAPGGSAVNAAPVDNGSSVAVIPFDNLSSDPEHAFFVDGLSDELLTTLAGVKGVRVPGRTSCFYYKGRKAPVAEIASALNVRYVLEGSVQRAADALHIVVQLTDASTGFQVWSQTYDRTMSDIFAMQRDIAGEIAARLPGVIGAPVSADWEGSVDPRAHEQFLIGLGKMRNRYAGSGWKEAYDAFAEAVRIDPNYPLANAYFAVATAIVQQPADRETVARVLAAAVAVAPDNPDVLFAQGFVEGAFVEDDPKAAQRALEFFDRAIAIDPSHSEAIHARIRYLKTPEEKIDAYQELVAIDPLFVNARLNYATSLADMQRWDEADAQFERIYQLRPDLGRGGALEVARMAGRTDLVGKYAFGSIDAEILGRPDGFTAAAMLTDFGADAEARYLMAHRDLTNFLFLPHQQEIFLKWVEGDFPGAARIAVSTDNTERGFTSIFGAIVAIMGRDADGAIALVNHFDPGVPDWDAEKIASVEELPSRMAVRVYAMALVLKGDEKSARKYFDKLIAASGQGNRYLPPSTYHLFRAADFAWSGRKREAIAEVEKARAAGWRYPRTYVVEFSPWPPIDGPYGLLSPLADEPKFKAIMKEIRAENAALLKQYDAEYAVLSKVRAMMATNPAPQ